MTAAASTVGSASLRSLVKGRAGAKEIAAYLDSLSSTERLAEVLGMSGRGVAALYDAVADAGPLPIEDLLPATEKGTRIYEGRNSLPMFTRFQKRFVRLSSGEVIGYNHQTMSFVTGPGYFVVREPSGEGALGKELLFDYTAAPPSEPEGWPTYKPNDRGLSKAVYAHMKDYCRPVARGVLVGKAYKNGVSQDAYFSLTLP